MPDIVKKNLWKGKRKPKMLRGLALNPNAALEARYYSALKRLVDDMTEETEKVVHSLYKKPVAQSYFAQDDTMSAQAKMILANLMRKFEPIFNLAAPPLATTMVGEVSQSSAKSLQTSLKTISGGLTLKTDILTGELREILKATIAENVSLIKSIPAQYFTQIEGAVMRSITTGQGEADLQPFLQKHTNITLRRARIISRDQTRKAFSNINFARMKKVGITEYEWLHSAAGQRPRKLHQKMSGHIYRIDDPPIIDEKTGQRGKPGDLINCRCRAVPIIHFDEGTEKE